MFKYSDTVDGHQVTNHGHDHQKNLWRFEHTERDGSGEWISRSVEYLDLGPGADTRESESERFVLAFPNAYGYAFHKCDFPEIPDEESNCWHVLRMGEYVSEEDQGIESKDEARQFLRDYLRENNS